MKDIKQLGLDEYEADEFVKPLFDSLIMHQVPTKILVDLFLETKIREYFEYLPPYIQNDEDFLWTALKENMVVYSQLPVHMQNAQTIEKDFYIDLLENGQITLETNLYPQDLSIAVAAMKHTFPNLDFLSPEFKNHPDVIMAIIKDDSWNRLPQEAKELVLNDDNLLKQFITEKPKNYDSVLTPEQQVSSEFLKILLHSDQKGIGYFLDEHLRKNLDPEIALLALQIHPSNIKLIHQKFSSPIKKAGAKADAYNFLKNHLEEQAANPPVYQSNKLKM